MVAKIKSGTVLPIASRAKAVQEVFREASTEVWYSVLAGGSEE